jgi:hypothetical protein
MNELDTRISQLKDQVDHPEILDQNRVKTKLETFLECKWMLSKAGNLLISDVVESDPDEALFNPKVSVLVQSYPEKPDVTFSIGDTTTVGKIVEFKKTSDGKWYVLTDNPSEWHLQNGLKHGWDWLWCLEKEE